MFIICPPCAIGATQLLSGHMSIPDLFYSWILSFIYLYFYIVQFNINNDISGVEGDRIDKPERPIPSNRVSIERAWHLYYITVMIYIVYSYSIGQLFPCLLWVFITIIHNFTTIQNTSIGKNSMMAPGIYAMVSVVWCLMNNVSNIYDHPKIVWNMVFNACVIAAAAVQQDMRDVEGDRVQGRRTFSVTMDNRKAGQLIIKILFCVLLLILIEASLVEQVRIVSKSTYMLINCLLYGIMIIRHLFSYDVRKTYEFYLQSTFFFYTFTMPIIRTN
ncbi:unnamed protein product [Adineta steineri]|uniref:UbiA prenyltransferase family protein n=1 Tax=Adineta steineri TaxID=433720 RepID=A0A818WBH7_9BILA|nr:unnamed protein product [Adineta steineri]CAF3723601.1 unnamed protein product [Adineta steineri]